eukprot:CAMPEP_0206225144 /NCGR_PEP_ID=MMETSP0047_2-20121206/7396_1 /ASSEMBLY_ACC=CAM_ASM_000192 /TAXON_ID=195065 /ORGANISM="Chroomonas mesostigmatica_cf, Strain CCMP1168" /LENGTH=317 /DNA_ID=CAMNT_0053648135 /DNA_START=211 /DNA_END=1164 /DNA_ORIENTATION=-
MAWSDTHSQVHMVPADVRYLQAPHVGTWWQPKHQEPRKDSNTLSTQGTVVAANHQSPPADDTPSKQPSPPLLACGGKAFRWQRALAEIVPTAAVFIISLVVDDLVPPHERPLSEYAHELGTISHPKKQETVEVTLLIFLSWGIPAITGILFSLARRDPLLLYSTGLGLFEDFTLTHVITSFGKKVAGSLRPNFMELCQWDGVKCNANRDDAMSARQSFPSGHASHAAGGLVFMSLLIATHVPMMIPKAPQTAVRIVAVLPFLMAFWIAISRTRDNYHRFEDIIAGIAIGAGVAGLIFKCHFRRSGEQVMPLSATMLV